MPVNRSRRRDAKKGSSASFPVQALIGRIPCGTAPHDSLGDPAPLGDLNVVGAHPAHWHRGKAALFTETRKTQPAGAEFRRDGSTTAGEPAPISEDSLLDEVDRVLDPCPAFHLSPFDRRWVHHPHFPDPPSGIQERAIARVFCDLRPHLKSAKNRVFQVQNTIQQ